MANEGIAEHRAVLFRFRRSGEYVIAGVCSNSEFSCRRHEAVVRVDYVAGGQFVAISLKDSHCPQHNFGTRKRP